jgi:uncharacterized damage-inducible protein DinB
MKLYTIVSCLLLAPCAWAQTPNPFVTDLKGFYAIRKADLVRAADRMPAEDYGFKPTPEMRSFGELVAHIADAQMGFCSVVKGEPRKLNAAAKTSKADLVAALKASFDECDSAFDTTTDTAATQVIKTGNSERSKFGSLIYATIHDNEEYGYLAVYLRLKGLIPPSTNAR